ncbi:immunity 49 family protein [Streptomyces sp. NRRL WC-3549]|uniref:immunity 49 family protein n=1 Tax=Streptomyces sp. NRRL WC-3549 TaxID=1463925 RepID=UPI0009EA6FFE|nr:immunity 49 family protein [Streptomyces sp. NRRL WC-3549]
MMTRVEHHGMPGTNDESYAQDLGSGLTGIISLLEQSSSVFDIGLMDSTMYLQACLAVDPDASHLRTWEALVTAMQLHDGMFAAAKQASGQISYRIADETRIISATGPTRNANPGNWINAFWLTVVCRDQARMTQLCEFDLTSLRASGAEYDDFMYGWVDSLQKYWMQRPGLIDKLQETIQGSYPEAIHIAGLEIVEKILYQPIDLFHFFLQKDHEGFNHSLIKALEMHKSYWTATDERARSVEGYLALGPLAVACLAYDAGFPITVTSDYIPSQLINRAWVGEFPT